MQLQQRINAFVALGKFLGQFSLKSEESESNGIPFSDEFYPRMLQKLQLAKAHNGWFTDENLQFVCKSWAEALSKENLEQWVEAYEINEEKPKTIAVVMAGNIPLVGFHDFLSVLIMGNKVLAKLSSNDKILLPFLSEYLIAVAPGFESYIEFTEAKLENFDAVIATGSNNTARYFDHYFGKYPNIIRKNRNSVAVLTGEESEDELLALANDVFLYFGLGCRNVSKIYVPKNYNFDAFFKAIFSWKEIINNAKYINNYDYNKAVYLMSDIKLLDNEFLLLKEDEGYSSPISVVFYETYNSLEKLAEKLNRNSENIQAVVASANIPNAIPFGSVQSPQLWDYADGVDTVKFLLDLN